MILIYKAIWQIAGAKSFSFYHSCLLSILQYAQPLDPCVHRLGAFRVSRYMHLPYVAVMRQIKSYHPLNPGLALLAHVVCSSWSSLVGQHLMSLVWLEEMKQLLI